MKVADCKCGGKPCVTAGTERGRPAARAGTERPSRLSSVSSVSSVVCMRCGLQQNSDDVEVEPAIIRWNRIQKMLRMATEGVTDKDLIRDPADVATMRGTDR